MSKKCLEKSKKLSGAHMQPGSIEFRKLVFDRVKPREGEPKKCYIRRAAHAFGFSQSRFQYLFYDERALLRASDLALLSARQKSETRRERIEQLKTSREIANDEIYDEIAQRVYALMQDRSGKGNHSRC